MKPKTKKFDKTVSYQNVILHLFHDVIQIETFYFRVLILFVYYENKETRICTSDKKVSYQNMNLSVFHNVITIQT
jgi:hypothetical protein